MNFNADGYLDAGLHDLELEGIIEHFVTAFPHSSSRTAIMAGYQQHRAAVVALGIPCTQLIDGSFVSSKADPGDIDLVGFMDADAVDALSLEDKTKLIALFSGPVTKANYKCDAYFVPSVPENHPMYQKLRTQRKYWMGEFGYDREDKAKGIVRINITCLPDASGDANA